MSLLESANKKLEKIEKDAYTLIPDAEPDGDITFAVACAVAEIMDMENNL